MTSPLPIVIERIEAKLKARKFQFQEREDIEQLIAVVRELTKLIDDQPHHPRCHTQKSPPFSDEARAIFYAKGCNCWKSKAAKTTP